MPTDDESSTSPEVGRVDLEAIRERAYVMRVLVVDPRSVVSMLAAIAEQRPEAAAALAMSGPDQIAMATEIEAWRASEKEWVANLKAIGVQMDRTAAGVVQMRAENEELRAKNASLQRAVDRVSGLLGVGQ